MQVSSRRRVVSTDGLGRTPTLRRHGRMRSLRPEPSKDVTRINGRLPTSEEHGRVRHLVLQQPMIECDATDDDLADVLPLCTGLESVVLSGVKGLSRKSLVVWNI